MTQDQATARERPILFSEPMVRAILAGKKTQTRRVVKPQPKECVRTLKASNGITFLQDWNGTDGEEFRCPYGKPGDRLWVRETWGLHRYFDDGDWHRGSLAGESDLLVHWQVAYRAEYGPIQEDAFWRPSIHMPRWASRITLEVTDVRVERLNEISEADAKAEGVEMPSQTPVTMNVTGLDGETIASAAVVHDFTHRGAFCRLWDGINGERAPWSSHPWVWVIGFRRVEAIDRRTAQSEVANGR